VALTPPYFSHGGNANLGTVLDFYARGVNKRDRGPTGDDTGTGADGNTRPTSFPLPGLRSAPTWTTGYGA
jgi:hypothetical protein